MWQNDIIFVTSTVDALIRKLYNIPNLLINYSLLSLRQEDYNNFFYN